MKPPKPIHIFFSALLGNLAALSILATFFMGMGIYLLVIFSLAASGEKKDTVPPGSVLVLDLWMNISDTPPTDGLDRIMDEALFGPRVRNLYLLEVVDAIERATVDERIEALFIHGSLVPENYGSGIAALAEIRRAIEQFKSADKPVYAYTTDPTLRDYYIMSAADHLYMNPFGVLGLNGLASESFFLGDAFAKYGIGVQVTRVGKYKSATEIFTGNKMSPADREQVSALLHQLWGDILGDIGESRGVGPAKLLEVTHDEGFFTAEAAHELGLIDVVGYFDEVITTLEEEAAFNYEIDSFEQIGMGSYIRAAGFRSEKSPFLSGQQIAVVYAEGDIVNGEGFPEQVGGERLAWELRQLREDDDVAAIVLRINSPGGSALAAELIQREVVLAQHSKPVVVSMGSLAASGGYWIAASADKIYAEPTTLTGSIGVWGLLFNFKEIANEHGITFDGVKTSRFADLYTITREKSEAEMALVQKFTDFIYEEFIEKVARGRGLPLEQVQEIAQGRVWTGSQAVEIGLVDEIGGLGDAIQAAVELSGLEGGWSLRQIPEKRTIGESIGELFSNPEGEPPVASAPLDPVGQAIGWLRVEMNRLRAFNDPRGIYARLPFEISY